MDGWLLFVPPRLACSKIRLDRGANTGREDTGE